MGAHHEQYEHHNAMKIRIVGQAKSLNTRRDQFHIKCVTVCDEELERYRWMLAVAF